MHQFDELMSGDMRGVEILSYGVRLRSTVRSNFLTFWRSGHDLCSLQA